MKEKSLIKADKESVFCKIKIFFMNLVKRKKCKNKTDLIVYNDSFKKSEFYKYIKNIENDDTRLLKLQENYETGKINEKDLTDAQIKDLLKLYKNQIDALKKTNERRKQKILEYRKNR